MEFKENVNIYSCKLGEKGLTEDKEIFDYCIENKVICVGFNDDTDYTKYSRDIDNIDKKEMERRRKEIYKIINEKGVEVNSSHKSSIKYIVLEMKKGDIVLVPHGRKKVKAIGEIIGDYEYRKDSALKKHGIYQFRKVEWHWIAKNEGEYIDVSKIRNDGRCMVGRGTIEKLSGKVNVKFLKNFLKNK